MSRGLGRVNRKTGRREDRRTQKRGGPCASDAVCAAPLRLPAFLSPCEALLLLALVVGCDHGGSSQASAEEAAVSMIDAADSRSATAQHAPPAATPAHRDAQPHPPPPCKAATVEGSVLAVPLETPGPLWGVRPPRAEDGGLSLVAASAVPDDVWIDVGKASRLTTRD